MGKVCLIIGGGRGMGAATARQMHSRDYALALMSPTESCETLAVELGGVAQRGRAESASDSTRGPRSILLPRRY